MNNVRNFVFIKDSEISFPAAISQINGGVSILSIDSLYTPYGFFIPVRDLFYSVLDYFESGDWDVSNGYYKTKINNRVFFTSAYLITHDGKVYVVDISGASSFHTSGLRLTRQLYGPGCFIADETNTQAYNVALAANSLGLQNKEIIDAVCEQALVVKYNWQTMNIKDIAEELTVRGYTKEFPKFINPKPIKED